MSERVLVTGATGFLGKALAFRLQSLGYEVIALGRNAGVGAQLQKNGLTFRCVDLADRERMIDSCNGIDYVFHVGALSSPWGTWQSFYNANVQGTQNVVDGCRQANVKRLIYVSTPSLYFDFTDRLNISESAPLPSSFANHYAKSKYMAEQVVNQAIQQGLAAITIRPRAIFGPGDQTIIPRLIQANQQRWIPIMDGGQAFMDLTYVDNVVDALLLCMHSPDTTIGKVYNITNGEAVRFMDMLELLFARLQVPLRKKEISYRKMYVLASILEWFSRTIGQGKEPIFTRYTIGVLAKSQTLDITAAKKELGYHPQVSIVEGIERFIDWWKTQHD